MQSCFMRQVRHQFTTASGARWRLPVFWTRGWSSSALRCRIPDRFPLYISRFSLCFFLQSTIIQSTSSTQAKFDEEIPLWTKESSCYSVSTSWPFSAISRAVHITRMVVVSVVPSAPTMRLCGATMTNSGSAHNADMKLNGYSSSASLMLKPISSVYPAIRTTRIVAWTANSNRYLGDTPFAWPHFKYLSYLSTLVLHDCEDRISSSPISFTTPSETHWD